MPELTVVEALAGEARVGAGLRGRARPGGVARLREEVGDGRGAQLVGRGLLEVGEALCAPRNMH